MSLCPDFIQQLASLANFMRSRLAAPGAFYRDAFRADSREFSVEAYYVAFRAGIFLLHVVEQCLHVPPRIVEGVWALAVEVWYVV